MFDAHFSFASSADSTPTSPSLTSSSSDMSSMLTRSPTRSVSPFSSALAVPAEPVSVSELASQFADSRIRSDSRIAYDSCASYANMDDDAAWSVPSIEEEEVPLSRTRTFPLQMRGKSPPTSRRAQRQTNARLLCSASHQQELAALVSRMVDAKDQCAISHSEVEDEGYNSGSISPRERRPSVMATSRLASSCRRGSEMRSSVAGSGTCGVSKDARFRRGSEKNHRRVRSGEK